MVYVRNYNFDEAYFNAVIQLYYHGRDNLLIAQFFALMDRLTFHQKYSY